VVVLVTVPLAEPHLGAGARGTAVAVALVVSAISCVTWLAAGRREHLIVAALAVLGVAGGALAGLSPLSPAIAFGCMATSAAGVRLKTEGSLAITAGTVAAFLAMALATAAPAGTLLGYPLTYIGFWVLGLTRRAYLLRAEQAEQTLAETRRAHDAETQAAALAERARMAREIHDVLAHSLAAVSVNLQAAEGLLGALPAGSPELAKAIECIGRAEAFTRDGLAEARRAILALRDDAVPLPDQLSALAGEYRADGDAPVDFQVTGSPRPVAAEAGLAAYRTAQEALTNARKHAPGQPVSLCLQFSSTDIAVAGEAADGDAAVDLVTALHPQVVLMDLNMPGCDGVTATRRITADHPGTRVVVLTTYADDESIIGALQAGALGYLTKDATRAEIGRAVLTAAAGQVVLDPAVQQRLLSAAARAHDAPGPPGDELTPREAEVLRLIADGRSNREIARALFVSEATVKTHVNRIFAKIGSRDRAQAIRYAYTHGYAEPAPPP
jgi:DNA-binding NarL/FixJ family response regulator/signal transduction histidine kinase